MLCEIHRRKIVNKLLIKDRGVIIDTARHWRAVCVVHYSEKKSPNLKPFITDLEIQACDGGDIIMCPKVKFLFLFWR